MIKKTISIWLSGLFTCSALTQLFFLFGALEITDLFGIEGNSTIYGIKFVVSIILSIGLFWYGTKDIKKVKK